MLSPPRLYGRTEFRGQLCRVTYSPDYCWFPTEEVVCGNADVGAFQHMYHSQSTATLRVRRVPGGVIGGRLLRHHGRMGMGQT